MMFRIDFWPAAYRFRDHHHHHRLASHVAPWRLVAPARGQLVSARASEMPTLEITRDVCCGETDSGAKGRPASGVTMDGRMMAHVDCLRLRRLSIGRQPPAASAVCALFIRQQHQENNNNTEQNKKKGIENKDDRPNMISVGGASPGCC
ncbi:hypothetical protein ZHAS_00016235 [Anopheles sinensis]|uniref:Uncharacterized protein n=1 Tax=Anopheles sinensis TaxID=74873 RepID=A0A084WD75_ANOSI|nr:hypothetical protein ZHAS_00016235 [Anopheles sinensis]